ncbi:MAG: acetyl-CoA C-acyltransferase [Alphaproteobacteria bacterium]|jgi:acetyl-CoA C-acetyltransferase|nr:acetyl-CoA C-acyltransferase [Alphaproteobacteria bacterium]MBP9878197.1 acetyl-CoA C-acyltransferase [Alphaproteobacteria bacterium]
MNHTQDPIVIVGCKRTPIGSFLGELSSLKATALGGFAIKAALQHAGLSGDQINEVMMGCVLPAGLGQAPARQAAFDGGVPKQAGAVTINKMCGSGMKAVMMAHDSLLAGTNNVVIAGGLESMSNAPYLLENARSGLRMGHQKIIDHMFYDGLEDPFGHGGLMGVFAEKCATHYQFTRQAQDDFAIASLKKAQKAEQDGTFAKEITAITLKQKKGDEVITADEQPRKANLEKIPQLKPAFDKDGTVTAANSSSISDGAAALVLMRQSEAERRHLKPLARILAHATHSQEPEWFTTAPIGSIQKVLEKANLTKKDIDLYEINEAFAVVAMAAMRDLSLGEDIVNIHGGACALGHPIGASGARILVTLLNALEARDLTRGVASLCIGGGEATAVAIERIR